MLAVEIEGLVQREVGLLLQGLECKGHALAVAGLEAVVDGERGVELAGGNRVVELVAVALEFRDVAREEITPVTVERLDVSVEHQRGNRVVDRRLPVVGALEHTADQPRNLGLAFGLPQVGRRGARDLRRRPRGPEQQRAGRHDDDRERGRASTAPAPATLRCLVLTTCLIHFAATSTECFHQLG